MIATAAAAAWPPTTADGTCPPHSSLYRHKQKRCIRIITRTSLYDLLGVGSSASTADIRSAYRRLAARYHPDVNSSFVAHEKFQALNLAAEVLTSDLRDEYDSQGAAALPVSRYKLLLDFLKQARAQGVSVLGEPGGDFSTVLGLDFNEAITGSAASVTMDVLGPCSDCKGSGMDAASQAKACTVCKGSGEIMVRQWSPEAGSASITLPRGCPACRGTGRTEQQDCKRCVGEGRVQVRRKVRFRVPGGVADGQVLRVKGQGHSGKYGGAPGDLLVKLQVYDLADVKRQGYDLHSVLELPLYEALLGGRFPVKTVRGHRHIIVPAGTQHGQLLCVEGAGVPRPGLNGVEYGHHYFEVAVRVPSAVAASEAELQLLQRLAAAVQQQGRGLEHHHHHRHHHHQQQQQQQQQQTSPSHAVSQAPDPALQASPDPSSGPGVLHTGDHHQHQHPTAAARTEHSSDPPEGLYG